ncbi:MAG: MFS transporter [Xanthobacteraceae bacterium]
MPSPDVPSRTSAIVFLALAGFASQAMVRSSDSLLPQVAVDMGTTVGVASIIVSAYSLMHGTAQLFMGPIGDRYGKYRMAAITCAFACVFVALCGVMQNLTTLTLARIGSGAFAGWIIPMGMAFVGDVVPYDRRQQVLGRYLSGQISGQLFGQAAGGILGDWLGWRGVFFVLAGILAVAAAGLWRELWTNPLTRTPAHESVTGRGFIESNRVVLSNPWARVIIVIAFLEYGCMFGAFAYIGAYLRQRFGISYAIIGLVISAFALGGLIYAGLVKQFVGRFGQTGLAAVGGILIGVAYIALVAAPFIWMAPIAVTFVGLGFYMLHNTLQTNATQMSPEARGTAVGLFSAALYLGQTAGVALAAPVIDRLGAAPIFITSGIALAALGICFSRLLNKRRGA